MQSDAARNKRTRRSSILKVKQTTDVLVENEADENHQKRRVSFFNTKTVQNYDKDKLELLDGSPVKEKIHETIGSDGVLTPGRNLTHASNSSCAYTPSAAAVISMDVSENQNHPVSFSMDDTANMFVNRVANMVPNHNQQQHQHGDCTITSSMSMSICETTLVHSSTNLDKTDGGFGDDTMKIFGAPSQPRAHSVVNETNYRPMDMSMADTVYDMSHMDTRRKSVGFKGTNQTIVGSQDMSLCDQTLTETNQPRANMSINDTMALFEAPRRKTSREELPKKTDLNNTAALFNESRQMSAMDDTLALFAPRTHKQNTSNSRGDNESVQMDVDASDAINDTALIFAKKPVHDVTSTMGVGDQTNYVMANMSLEFTQRLHSQEPGPEKSLETNDTMMLFDLPKSNVQNVEPKTEDKIIVNTLMKRVSATDNSAMRPSPILPEDVCQNVQSPTAAPGRITLSNDKMGRSPPRESLSQRSVLMEMSTMNPDHTQASEKMDHSAIVEPYKPIKFEDSLAAQSTRKSSVASVDEVEEMSTLRNTLSNTSIRVKDTTWRETTVTITPQDRSLNISRRSTKTHQDSPKIIDRKKSRLSRDVEDTQDSVMEQQRAAQSFMMNSFRDRASLSHLMDASVRMKENFSKPMPTNNESGLILQPMDLSIDRTVSHMEKSLSFRRRSSLNRSSLRSDITLGTSSIERHTDSPRRDISSKMNDTHLIPSVSAVDNTSPQSTLLVKQPFNVESTCVNYLQNVEKHTVCNQWRDETRKELISRLNKLEQQAMAGTEEKLGVLNKTPLKAQAAQKLSAKHLDTLDGDRMIAARFMAETEWVECRENVAQKAFNYVQKTSESVDVELTQLENDVELCSNVDQIQREIEMLESVLLSMEFVEKENVSTLARDVEEAAEKERIERRRMNKMHIEHFMSLIEETRQRKLELQSEVEFLNERTRMIDPNRAMLHTMLSHIRQEQ